MYVLALDLSLSDSGGCVFTEQGKPVEVFSIPTSGKLSHPERLKIIGDYLQNVKNKYSFKTVVLESGFSRYTASTQALYKVLGVASYIFSGIEQITYAPSTVKKYVTGNGKSEKSEVEKCILELWPDLKISNNDESDAVGVGLCHFRKMGIIRDGKKKNL